MKSNLQVFIEIVLTAVLCSFAFVGAFSVAYIFASVFIGLWRGR